MTILDQDATRLKVEAIADMSRPKPRFVARNVNEIAPAIESAWSVRRIDGVDSTSAHIFTGPNAKRYAKGFAVMAEAMADEDGQHDNGAAVD
jgi:hypothetical protein